MKRCRCCNTPCDVTSKNTYSHPSLCARCKNLCKKNLPGMELPDSFRSVRAPICTYEEDTSAVFLPAYEKICDKSASVVDFPLVPVTPITHNFLEGCRYKNAPTTLHSKWYSEYTNNIILFEVCSLIAPSTRS